MEKPQSDFTQDYSRIEQYALLLGSIRDHLCGKQSILRPTDMPEILMDFIRGESNLLMINYSFAYFGIKEQLVNKAQKEDAIKCMREMMGWELPERKDKIKSMWLAGQAMYNGVLYNFEEAFKLLHEAIELDPSNQTAWYWLAETYKEDGEFKKEKECRDKVEEIIKNRKMTPPEEEIADPTGAFQTLLNKFYDKKELITKFCKKRTFYANIIENHQGILSQFGALLNQVRNYFRKKDHNLPPDQIPEVLDDVINDLLEWMSIVGGVAFYCLKFGVGSEQERGDILDVLLHILGWKEHTDLPKVKGTMPDFPEMKPDSIEENEEEFDEEWEEIDEEDDDEMYDNLFKDRWEVLQKTEGFGILPVSVVDYEYKDVLKNIIDGEELLIKDGKISIEFSYPLSTKALFEYEQSGGFTRKDLFRCIYEGYKTIYDAEEQAVGDPGTYEMLHNRRRSEGPYGIWGHYMEDLVLEGMRYNENTKVLHLFIGS